jgi:hypothetical protein
VTLVYHELIDSLTQEITIGGKPIQVYALCPHLYLHNGPSGALQMRIYDEEDSLIAFSENQVLDALPITEPYFHGQVRFLISALLKAHTTYRMQLKAGTGYTYAAASHVGWCNDFDLRRVPATYQPNTGVNAALDLEIWESRASSRGAL